MEIEKKHIRRVHMLTSHDFPSQMFEIPILAELF